MICSKCGKREGIAYSYYRGKKTGETRFPVDTTHERVTKTYKFDPWVKEMALCAGCIKKRYLVVIGLLLLALAAAFGLWFLAERLTLSDGDNWVALYLLLKFISGGLILNILIVLIVRLFDLSRKRLYGSYAQQMVFARARRLPENRGYDTFMTPDEYMDFAMKSRFSGGWGI